MFCRRLPWITHLSITLAVAGFLSLLHHSESCMPQIKNDEKLTLQRAGLGMFDVYLRSILPLEKKYGFAKFHSVPMIKADFVAPPTIVFVGQYSAGKTSLIRRLLGQDYPEIRIAPEPSTDNFIFITDGFNESNIVDGHLAAINPNGFFHSLSKFGSQFLNRFRVTSLSTWSKSAHNNGGTESILKSVNILDTPGILSGEKQRLDRGYDFPGVINWFSERSSRIYLIFDPHKLDISDEMLMSVKEMHSNENAMKIRFILNKVDLITESELKNVLSTLIFYLSKVLKNLEVPRIYLLGEPNAQSGEDEGKNRNIRKKDQDDFLDDLKNVPLLENSRRLDYLVRRATLVQVHALIISELHDKFRSSWWMWLTWKAPDYETLQKLLISDLSKIYQEVQKKYSIPIENFPDLKNMQDKLSKVNFNNFASLDKEMFMECKNFMFDESLSLLKNEIFSRNSHPEKKKREL